MPRLLIVSPYGTTAGGAEQWLLGILGEPALADADWAVDAIVMQEGPLVQALRARHVTAITLAIPASPAGIVRRLPALRKAITIRRPDVVVGNGVKAQLAVSLALVGTGIPTVWVKHDHSHDAALARPLGRSATLVAPTALEVGQPTGRHDLVVIEPPRPPDPLPRQDACARLHDLGWKPTRRLHLGMISRLVPYKGVDLAIEALALPGARDWDLLVIGDDDPSTPGESRRLAALAARLDVRDRVFFAGAIASGGSLLSAVDAVGVLTRPGQEGAPSKEGYGIVASEALMAKVPVIVAQEGPVSRRIDAASGPAGVTLEQPDAASLGRALALLSDDDTRTAMGLRGYAVAQALPTQTEVARRFVQVLDLTASS